MTTIVYQYGLAAPHEGAEIVREQMALAHRFRNSLVEIERDRRREVRAAEATHVPDVGLALDAMRAAEAVLEALFRRAAVERQRTGKRRVVGELASEIVEARATKRAAKEVWWAARKLASTNPALIVALDEIRERVSERNKAAAAASSVAWGTKALVVEAATKSFRETALYDDDGAPQDPRFVRGSESRDAVGVQLQGGLSDAEVMGGEDTRLQIVAPPLGAWNRAPGEPGRHAAKRLAREGEVRLRVGSDDKRRPVWAAWRLHMDCPLPNGATIKFAAVHRRRVGPYGHWTLILTLDVPGTSYARHAVRYERQGSAVAVDLGWRVDEKKIRVAAWRGDDGCHGAIEIDAATLGLLRLPRLIQSERSLAFDRMLFGLVWWLTWGPAPEWLAERCQHAARWKSPGRLVGLFRDWERYDGDEAIWAQLESFCAHDRHQWAQEESLRQRALARRREIYRIVASRLAQEYDTLVVEKFDLRDVIKGEARESGEREDHQTEAGMTTRQLAAPSVLRESLAAAFRSRGKTVDVVPAVDSTRIHATCGAVEDRAVIRAIMVTCDACGERFDQDDNACQVLLSRARERRNAAQPPGVARKAEKASEVEGVQETRRAKALRLRAEREMRVAGAREALAKSAE